MGRRHAALAALLALLAGCAAPQATTADAAPGSVSVHLNGRVSAYGAAVSSSADRP
ncbi:MAG TPA: hypothetical protein VMU82_17155 [Acetobacteraceae bacterium]|nr:hypothetical protein [Acetobacteraceae bacterium]